MKKWIVLFLTLFFSTAIYAGRYPAWYGVTASAGYGAPQSLRGWRTSLQWQPEKLNQQVFAFYFDLSLAHWWVDYPTNKNITIMALAPVFRLYLARKYVSPYFEGSVGPAYMTKTTLGTRDLGSHWTFQDLVGFGASFGYRQQFDASIRLLHYSNANLAPKNSGIDVWLLATIGYHF